MQSQSLRTPSMLLFPFVFVAIVVSSSFDVVVRADDDAAPLHKLESDIPIPLVGFGIGNLQHEIIPDVVRANLDAGVVLVDTAHASKNEDILAGAVAKFDHVEGLEIPKTRSWRGRRPAVDDFKTDLKPLHVVTKVWYTHLGYERTKLSIEESLANLDSSSPRQVYVHMLIHWPRCNDKIPWMNCEEEENNLPQKVKDAGPPPHLNNNHAIVFSESWRAMEDIFLEHQKKVAEAKSGTQKHPPLLASIGVSNFEYMDMKRLIVNKHRIVPHMYQGNAWTLFNDPNLMEYLKKNNIFFQAYAVFGGILHNKDQAPNAYGILSSLSRELTEQAYYEEMKSFDISEATVLLAYFVKSDIGVVPRAASPAHRAENSMESISAILPLMTPQHMEKVKMAITALMKKEDIHSLVKFVNKLSSVMHIHWVDPGDGELVQVSDPIKPGDLEVHQSHPGHKFVVYSSDMSVKKEFTVDVGYGEEQTFHVEEL